MHPDLLNNSVFLRYYRQWQEDPGSIVFAPLAEYFLRYSMVDEAMKVCRTGLKMHPGLVSGRLVMAKVHLKRGNWEEAEDELRAALAVMPSNPTALSLMREVEALHREGNASRASRAFVPLEAQTAAEEREPQADPAWQTLTMAGIYASQGHYDQARRIYRLILNRDPGNEAAKRGLTSLPAAGI